MIAPSHACRETIAQAHKYLTEPARSSRVAVVARTEVTDLNDMVATAVVLMAGPMKDAGVTTYHCSCRSSLPVRTKQGYVEQALLNLLTNACRASRPGQTISVTTAYRKGASHAEVQVEDSGEGIPIWKMPHVFQPFFSTWGGLGLGLSIARELVRQVGGQLVLESQSCEGTRAIVRVPIDTTPGPFRDPSQPPERSLSCA